MKKIISLFKRDYEGTRLVYDEVVEGAEWVLDGEGVATEKFDGTACAVINGTFYKRREVKQDKPVPEGWVHWSLNPEQKSGHGWAPVGFGPEDAAHRMAWDNAPEDFEAGTYELVGPKVQKNPYGLTEHLLWKHGSKVLEPDMPRDFEGLKEFLLHARIEGIVWHHPDGRMVQIKTRDFHKGLWPPAPASE